MRIWAVLCALTFTLTAQAADRDAAARARLNYMQYCAGCHLANGQGAPEKGIPSMRGGILGTFLGTPEGRAYLLQVPGVTNTPLDNASTAQLMNWVIRQFKDNDQVVTEFDAQDVAQGRAHRLSDPALTRARLLAH